MMAVEEYLDRRTLDDLAEDLAIQITRHDSLPLAILNYHQIDSPKLNPVARECRGLVVNTDTQQVVARSFPRFFNWGEHQDEMNRFDWNDFHCETKHDGSLVTIFCFDGRWMANTRASFGEGNIQGHDLTWHDGICKSLKIESLQELGGVLDDTLTYVCEFCSPWNKIVRHYPEPKLYLLTVFRGTSEMPAGYIHEDLSLGIFSRELPWGVYSLDEAIREIRHYEENDPTFEGFVIRDRNNLRFKMKTATYLGFHRTWANGGLCRDKDLLPFVLQDNGGELLATFPEAREAYESLENRVEELWRTTLMRWSIARCSGDNRKGFALAAKDHPMSGILFRCYDEGGGVPTLRRLFVESPERILKAISSGESCCRTTENNQGNDKEC